MDLEPIEPQAAVELYLADREREVASSTLRSHRSRLQFFVKWCEEEGITNLNELTGRDLNEYRIWRRNDGDLAPASENCQMDTLRVFLRWLESIEGVPKDFHENVWSPAIDRTDEARDVMLDPEDAEEVLSYLETYYYASLDHVLLSLLWQTMMRRGAAHGLDVRDYHREDQCLEILHRPETDTPIKNGQRGERLIALTGWQCSLLDDWLQDRRPDVADEHGRRPLLATAQGRIATSTIGKKCYQWTRPCVYSNDCPHDRDPDDCEAMDTGHASKCPSSVSSHPFRRGSITHHLNEEIPETAVGDRANVSQDVLERHYDQRTKREKMEQRRQYLDRL
ncbi:site-specific integrase [Natronomonas salina]|uniref:tyrosine-type recombinase/integrase n=1 Tax=Natronomonas salina TaxID=1710540 RepID=UPI0015B64481|nr:site-specific integrase [Natronomonas salina]QLD90375.1 site-specific integrase [Natronomonas salina]